MRTKFTLLSEVASIVGLGLGLYSHKVSQEQKEKQRLAEEKNEAIKQENERLRQEYIEKEKAYKEILDRKLDEIKQLRENPAETNIDEESINQIKNHLEYLKKESPDAPGYSQILKKLEAIGKKESSIFGDIIDFVESLSSIQLLAFINLCGLSSLFFTHYALIIVRFSNFLIDKLDLENKFPFLKRYLSFRKTITEVSTYYRIGSSIVVFLILVWVNFDTFFL